MNRVAGGAIIWVLSLGLAIAQSFDSTLGAPAASVAPETIARLDDTKAGWR